MDLKSHRSGDKTPVLINQQGKHFIYRSRSALTTWHIYWKWQVDISMIITITNYYFTNTSKLYYQIPG